jgi:protein-tyrosine phosphatase
MFSQLGVRAVYDLRGNAERAAEPDPWDSFQVSLLEWQLSVAGATLLSAEGAREAERILHTTYTGMLSNAAPALGRLLGRFASPDGLPVVFHCSGGKDRTGIVAALLLGALGVDRATVLDDYEMTGRWQRPDNAQEFLGSLVAMGMRPEAARAFIGSPRWAMADALDWLDQSYGGTTPYLLGPAGLDETVLAQLTRALTE